MVHVGELIKQELKKKRLSVAEFARQINTNRNNVYDIFNRTSIDTELLFKISTILEYDFFKHYNPLSERRNEEAQGIENKNKWLLNQFEKLHKKIDILISIKS